MRRESRKIEMPTLPAEARRVIADIEAAGGRAYLVGGALRDLLLGDEPGDWDFAATLPAEKLLELWAGARLTGGVCGTVRAPFGARGWCEITPCRTEAGYSDRRHPDEVRFVPDILADLGRRDFTVNAMAFDGRMLLDPFGGQEDLSRRVLRCVGDAGERFAEDPLRVLRLFRFAAQLGFTAEWNSFVAAGAAAADIATLPPERVLGEMKRILLSDGVQVLSGLIAQGGLRRYGFSFAPALANLAQAPREPLCRWWALMALCGAAPQVVGEAFGFSRRFMASLSACTALYRAGPAVDKISLKMKLSETRLDYAPVAAMFAAVSPAWLAEPALYAAVAAAREPYRVAHLAVDGEMLRRAGIEGRRCGQVLRELLGAVIKNPALNRAPVLLGLISEPWLSSEARKQGEPTPGEASQEC